MTGPELRYAVANGLRFAYFEEGSGPLVLLLHGFPDTPRGWDAVRPALAAAGYRAVSPFMRGYHPTAVPEDGAYDADTLGRDVLALIDAFESPAIVVGHDWGASAAYVAAGLGPGHIRHLVTVGLPHPSALCPVPRVLWGSRHMFAFQRKRAEDMVRAHDFAYLDVLVRRWSPTWEDHAAANRAVKQVFRERGCLEAALGYYRAIRLKPSPALRRPLAVPNTAFCGTDDPFLKPPDYERARRYFQAPYEVVAMPGGHFLHREHPELFNRALLDVLAQSRK